MTISRFRSPKSPFRLSCAPVLGQIGHPVLEVRGQVRTVRVFPQVRPVLIFLGQLRTAPTLTCPVLSPPFKGEDRRTVWGPGGQKK